MGIIIGGVSPQDLILDGSSVSLYVGGNPPIKVWPNVVQITLDTGWGARNQLLAALTARGLSYWKVTEIPFEIELVGSGSVQSMFDGCAALTTVPNMDTSNVTDMRSMFNDCTSLTSVPPMDTSNVTSMEGMFSGCAALVSVPDMDTSNVTSMAYMFSNCVSLTTAPEMDTSKVTTMSSMFDGCAALTYVPEMDTRNVTDTNYMLYGCSSLTDGNVRLYGKHPQVVTWDMITASGLTKEPFIEVVQITLGTGYDARNQFRNALSARGLDYRTVREVPFEIELVGTGVTNNMFDYCAALVSVPDMDTSNVTSMRYMFRDCKALKEAPAMDTRNVTDMYYLFYGCLALTYVPDMHTSNVTSMAYMFYNCAALTDGNVRLIGRHPNVSKTSMIYRSGLTREPFYDVMKITLGTGDQARDQLRAALSDRGLDYRTVTEIPFIIESAGSGSMRNMFNGCSALTTVPAMDTSNVTSMASMFTSCYALTTVPAMDTSQVTSMSGMFNNCSSLTYVPDMYTSQVTSTSFMFNGCSSLTDGKVRLIGRRPSVNTSNMITGSGLTREPFYDTSGNPI